MGHIFPGPQAEIGDPAPVFSVARFLLSVELCDEGIFVARTKSRCTIVAFLGDARVAVIEKSASEMRMVAAMHGGC